MMHIFLFQEIEMNYVTKKKIQQRVDDLERDRKVIC